MLFERSNLRRLAFSRRVSRTVRQMDGLTDRDVFGARLAFETADRLVDFLL